jgi:spermidine/putrescine transport system ATP-binding protein
MALLELRNITRRFGNLEAVKAVSLDIEAGEFFTLLGPSGCGKTTILRMIAGFDAPDEGELFLDGRPLAGIPPEQRPVHTVFQSFALFPHLTVSGNIAFPLEMAGKSDNEIKRRVNEALALVHLEEKGRAFPHELSGTMAISGIFGKLSCAIRYLRKAPAQTASVTSLTVAPVALPICRMRVSE